MILRKARQLSSRDQSLRRSGPNSRRLLIDTHIAANACSTVAPAFRWPRDRTASGMIATADSPFVVLNLRIALAMVDLDWLHRHSDHGLRHGNALWADLVTHEGEIRLHRVAEFVHDAAGLEGVAERLALTPAEQFECAVLRTAAAADWQAGAIEENAAAAAVLDRFRRDHPGPGSAMAMPDWLDTHLAALHARHAGGTVANWFARIAGGRLSRQTASNRCRRLKALGLL